MCVCSVACVCACSCHTLFCIPGMIPPTPFPPLRSARLARMNSLEIKNLLMPLFLMGCFLVDFQEVKRPLRPKSGKRPIKVRKRPIKEGKRPIKAMVLVGSSVGCLMGCFRAPLPLRKTTPLKRPIKRSLWKLPRFRFQTLRETVLRQRLILCMRVEKAPVHLPGKDLGELQTQNRICRAPFE